MLPLAEELTAGLAALGEEPAHHPCDKYLAFIEELSRWNRAYRLSGIRDAHRMLSHHVLDSLSLLPYLQGRRCLDAATGAGLPGLILALAQPDREWTLVDSAGKRIRFLNHVIPALGIGNATAVQARVEEYHAPEPFETVTSRAFTTVPGTWRAVEHLLAPGGVLLAMKGARPQREVEAGTDPEITTEIRPVAVPGVDSERNIVLVRRPPADAGGARQLCNNNFQHETDDQA